MGGRGACGTHLSRAGFILRVCARAIAVSCGLLITQLAFEAASEAVLQRFEAHEKAHLAWVTEDA